MDNELWIFINILFKFLSFFKIFYINLRISAGNGEWGTGTLDRDGDRDPPP